MKGKTTGLGVVIALAMVALGVIFFWRPAAVEAVYPVEKARRSLAEKVGTRLSGLWSGAAAKAENVRLRRERDALVLACEDRAALEAENLRLRQALDFRARLKGRWVAAALLDTGGAAANVKKVVRVDRGSLSGVAVGMAVRVPDGLVGRVVSVTPHTAEVLLVTDPSLKVACTLEGYAKSFGLLCGGTEERLSLRFLRVGDRVAPQTRVVTSGLGGVFPAGIPVGNWVSGGGTEENAREGEVEPAVDFATLEEVFIRCEE